LNCSFFFITVNTCRLLSFALDLLQTYTHSQYAIADIDIVDGEVKTTNGECQWQMANGEWQREKSSMENQNLNFELNKLSSYL
jgi:hypothetical protein